MFTGIVEAAGVIESLDTRESSARLRVRAPEIAAALKISDSIAVNGCCLTAVEISDGCFIADLSGETLRVTSFGELKPGRRVNLERPLAAGAPVGGHFVQGHVDGIGRVTHLHPDGENWWYGVRVPEPLQKYVAKKGSIAFDGISLTVAAIHEGVVETAIIP
ncbi:MAG: riboflavin synthase, partial [Acidobacteria bacterium]|nr:riboflavin synthase [Acidobacteriota bacterium]